MKIYLDLIFLLNFFFDLILLISVSLILRRNMPFYRLIIGAFIGSLSIFFLFLKINSFQLFILKVIISIVMVIMSFSYRNVKYTLRNLLFLYSSSILLGGFLYFLNMEFAYKQVGLVFYFKGLSINVIFLILFSPLIIYIYIRQTISLKNNYSKYYQVDIYYQDKIIKCNGYLDTGNTLCDPYFKKPVILINQKKLSFSPKETDTLYVPYQTIDNHGIIKCFKVNKINIKGVGTKENLLVGIINNDIKIDGIDLILHYKLLEE
ncbi:MAG: sigma-E processing peptidase SpoIIGA [Bacilli bacterium]|nr:sigma-E processing peptidase SpoIIGA [Bacilli bacterium]MDD4809144.1 sigma-E processing peptidase SpoIIGA [Bacilli bacterium]